MLVVLVLGDRQQLAERLGAARATAYLSPSSTTGWTAVVPGAGALDVLAVDTTSVWICGEERAKLLLLRPGQARATWPEPQPEDGADFAETLAGVFGRPGAGAAVAAALHHPDGNASALALRLSSVLDLPDLVPPVKAGVGVVAFRGQRGLATNAATAARAVLLPEADGWHLLVAPGGDQARVTAVSAVLARRATGRDRVVKLWAQGGVVSIAELSHKGVAFWRWSQPWLMVDADGGHTDADTEARRFINRLAPGAEHRSVVATMLAEDADAPARFLAALGLPATLQTVVDESPSDLVARSQDPVKVEGEASVRFQRAQDRIEGVVDTALVAIGVLTVLAALLATAVGAKLHGSLLGSSLLVWVAVGIAVTARAVRRTRRRRDRSSDAA